MGEIDPKIQGQYGAGISCGQDVYDVILAGAQATGSTSGIIKVEEPQTMVEDMLKNVRSAWNQTYSMD